VKIRALHGEVELVQAEDLKGKVKELERQFKSKGCNVVITNLTDVRDGMRDPM